MKMVRKVTLLLFFASVLILQFQNCSSYSESTLFQNDLNSTSSVPTDGNAWLKVDINSIIVRPEDDHFQIGGTCYTGNSLDNYITYTLKENGTNRLLSVDFSRTDTIRSDVRCENGKYYAVVYLNHPTNGRNPLAQSYTLQLQLHLIMSANHVVKTPVALKEISIY